MDLGRGRAPNNHKIYINSSIILTFLLVQDLERYNEFMGATLDNSHFCFCFTIKIPKVEGHRAELLVDCGEKLPRIFHLQHVRLIGFLVNGDFGIFFPEKMEFSKNELIKFWESKLNFWVKTDHKTGLIFSN